MGSEAENGDHIDKFESGFLGDLIRSGDSDYDDARAVWNGMIDKRPDLVAQCQDVADVISAVEFARERDLLVAIRGGGHNAAGLGTCDDGIVIDLSPMNWVDVDPDARRVRGGGGAFGIVTAFEFEAHPIGTEVATVETWHPIEDATAAFDAWRDFVETAPRTVSGEAIIWGIPEDPHFPEEHHNDPVAIITAVHAGDPEEGEDLLRPLREFGEPLFDFSGRTRYLDLQQGFDPFFPAGEHRYYQGSIYLDSLDDEVIADILDRAESRPDPRVLYYVWNLGGAITDVPEHATAFSGREHPYLLAIDCKWDDPEVDEAVLDWARSFQRDMDVHSPGESYRNFPGLGEADDLEP